MKKLSLILVCILLLSLCSCAWLPYQMGSQGIKGIYNWSFRYNPQTDDYSLLFQLVEDNSYSVAEAVTVDVSIIGDAGERVHKKTHSLTLRDFEVQKLPGGDKALFADLRIPAADITEGTAPYGTLFFTVYQDQKVIGDADYCIASVTLPVKAAELVAPDLPTTVTVKDREGKTASELEIRQIRCIFDKYNPSYLKIAVMGEKTYGKQGDIRDVIGYQLYDSQGKMVDSGTITLDDLAEGDRFEDDSIVFYFPTPGETYTLTFQDSET